MSCSSDWVFLLGLCTCVLSPTSAGWAPHIQGFYSQARGTLIVSIAPHLPEAFDYYVCAEREDDYSIFDQSRCINESHTEHVYEVSGIPVTTPHNYNILVRPRDRHGQYLTPFWGSRSPVTIPPSPTTGGGSNHDDGGSIDGDDDYVITTAVVSSTTWTWTTGDDTENDIGDGDGDVGGARGRTDSYSTDASTTPEHGGFHVEKWVIIMGCVVLFFFLAFIGVMLYVGRGCRTSSQRRLSVRSRTSQATHTSWTVFSEPASGERHNGTAVPLVPAPEPGPTAFQRPAGSSEGPEDSCPEADRDPEQEKWSLGSGGSSSVEITA